MCVFTKTLLYIYTLIMSTGWRISHHGRSSRRSQKVEDGKVAGVVVEGSDVLVVGMAVCWGHRDAYYLNLRTVQEGLL